MDIGRHAGHAPRLREIEQALAAQPAACIGCTRCTGLCRQLIDLMTLPEVVLGRGGGGT